MSEYRRYNKRQKLSVVLAAETAGLTVTAEQTGIPKSTIAYWMERPEFAQFRTKAREELADEIKTVAHLAWQRLGEALNDKTVEPRDIIFAAEKATSLMLLMSGEATERTESRSLSDVLDDHERATLKSLIVGELADREARSGDSGDGVDAGAAPVST